MGNKPQSQYGELREKALWTNTLYMCSGIKYEMCNRNKKQGGLEEKVFGNATRFGITTQVSPLVNCVP